MTWTKENHYGKGRWTITNDHISFEIHQLLDGSGRKEEYPDGVIVSPQQATEYADKIVEILNLHMPDFRPIKTKETS